MDTQNKPTILVVIADSSQTGAPRQLAAYLPLIQGFSIHVACPSGWLFESLENSGLTLHRIPSQRSPGKKCLRKLLQELRPALVHAHGIRAAYWCFSGKSLSAPIIYTEHLWTSDFHLKSRLREVFQRHLLKTAAKKAVRVVAVSHAVKNFFEQSTGIPPHKIEVVYGCVTQRAIERSRPDTFTVGTLGSLEYTKGVDTLIKAFSRANLPPGAQLLIGGSGPEAESLQLLVRKLGVSKTAHFEGGIANSSAFYAKLSVYVQASRSESFGMSPLEAALQKLPVIVSNKGALPEVFIDESAIIFPGEDVPALAKALESLANDQDAYWAACERAFVRAQYFTPEKTAAAHSRLYREILI